MTEPRQNLANHARYVPLYHLVLFAMLGAYMGQAAQAALRHPSWDAGFQVILGTGVLLTAWYARAFALTVQDRVIRLELELRVQRVAPELAARFTQLTKGQFTALRFANDAELPGLLREVLDGKVTRGSDIKKRITDWQGDYLRV